MALMAVPVPVLVGLWMYVKPHPLSSLVRRRPPWYFATA